MDITNIVQVLLGSGISLYMIINGWIILKHKKEYIAPNLRFGLWLVKIIYGEDRALQKKTELTEDKHQTSFGKQMLFFGVVFLLIIIFQFLANK